MLFRAEAVVCLWDNAPRRDAVVLDPPEGSEMLTQGYEPPMLTVEIEAPTQAAALAELLTNIDEQLAEQGIEYARIDGYAEPAPRLTQRHLAEMGISMWTCHARAALNDDLTDDDIARLRAGIEAEGMQVLGIDDPQTAEDDWTHIHLLARGMSDDDVCDRVSDVVSDSALSLRGPEADFLTGLGVDARHGLPPREAS
jgi:hypothetical protein